MQAALQDMHCLMHLYIEQRVYEAVHQAAACGTAGKCGYHVAPLQEVLAAGRLKYLDLLGGALAAAVGGALHRDAQVRSSCPVDASHRYNRGDMAADALWQSVRPMVSAHSPSAHSGVGRWHGDWVFAWP